MIRSGSVDTRAFGKYTTTQTSDHPTRLQLCATASGPTSLVVLRVWKVLYNVKYFEMTNSIDPDDWISQKQAAEIRGVTRQAINEIVRKDRFETLEVGGKTLVKREEVEDYEPKKGGRPPKDNSPDSSSEGN